MTIYCRWWENKDSKPLWVGINYPSSKQVTSITTYL
jgi:hypothetical protein